MEARTLDDLETAIGRVLEALVEERRRSRELKIEVAELEARLARAPEGLDDIRAENNRLRRNAAVAAARLENLLDRL